MSPFIRADAPYQSGQIDGTPTLGKSTIVRLCTASPLHAWTHHAYLNPDFIPEPDEQKFDVGTAVHDLFLRGVDKIAVVPHDSWRTNASKELAAEARADGRTPLLEKDAARVYLMFDALRQQIESFPVDPPLFGKPGTAEQAVVWEESGALLRARLDWLHESMMFVDDLKTTTQLANPARWSRSIFQNGYDIQAELYTRGVAAITGTTPTFRLVVVESSAPYGLSVIELAPSALTLARKKVDWAVELWRKCLEADDWPGYEQRVAYAELPLWEESAWLAKELA